MDYNNGVPIDNNANGWQQENQYLRDVQSKSRQYMNYHVIGQMSDGSRMEGIIEDVDDDGVTMLVPEDIEADERQFGYGGYGGYGRRRFRRFRRRRFPFTFFVFPFFFPYPYYY